MRKNLFKRSLIHPLSVESDPVWGLEIVSRLKISTGQNEQDTKKVSKVRDILY